MSLARRNRNFIHLFNCLNAFLPSSPFFATRRRLLRWCGADVGEGAKINTGVRFYWHNVTIGDGTWVGPECCFSSTPEATIAVGENCDIAPGVAFMTGSHELGGSKRRAGKGKSASIRVGDGCWIGARAIILGGADIGAGCVIAAGAVILPGKYAEDSLIAGVPGRVKRGLQ